MLANYLAKRNAVSASQRQDVIRHFRAGDLDIVLLDIRLGQGNGLDLLREIRSRSDVPVIVITGHRRDEIDRVVGLELGADDYVTKPFGGARTCRADTCRAARTGDCEKHIAARGREWRLQFGGWQLDSRARRLTGPNGVLVALTKGEYALLIAFLGVR